MKPAMTPQQAEFSDSARSSLSKYRELAVGHASLLSLIYYELCTLGLSALPGLPGFASRAFLYPFLFGSYAGKAAFGRGIILRRPAQIAVGKSCLFDDYAALDVRGDDASIAFGNHVSIGRFTTIAAKGGHIRLGDAVNIGSYCRVATQTSIEIEESVLVAAYSYIGPGNHQAGDGHTPLIARAMEKKGGVKIGAHVWIGSHVTVLDGIRIGAGSIIGAHSLVREDIPAGVIAAGCPARVIRTVQE